MATQELINYIIQAQSFNLSTEQIIQNLKTNGWSEGEIYQAMKQLDVAKNNVNVPISTLVSPSMAFSRQADHVFLSKKVAAIIGIFCVLIIVAGIYIFFRLPGKPQSQQTTSNIESDLKQNQQSSKTPVSPARESFEKMRTAMLNKDETGVKMYYSKNTLELFNSGGKITFYKDVQYISEISEGDTVVIRAKQIEGTGYAEEVEMVFIEEGGVWKVDFVASMDRAIKKETQKTPAAQEPFDGTIDLAVVDIEVYPDPPHLSNKDTKIAFTVKNLGNKSLIGQQLLIRLFLGENQKFLGSAGTQPVSILAGESMIFDYDWGFLNEEIKLVNGNVEHVSRFNEPGVVQFFFSVNEEKEIAEKDYSNNQMVKNIEFVK